MSQPTLDRAPHLPQPRFTPRRVAAEIVALLLILGLPALFIWMIVADVRNGLNRWELDHRGARTTARVVATRTEAAEEGPGPTFLTVEFGTSTAEVEVVSEGHAVGSQIQIAYDAADPSRAIATEDAPIPVGVGSFWLAVLLFGLVSSSVSRLRRGKVRRRRAPPVMRSRTPRNAFDAQALLDARPSRRSPLHD
jgi:uncharacterized protein DUF3592